MCGRFAASMSAREMARRVAIETAAGLEPEPASRLYNIPPSLTLTAAHRSREGVGLDPMVWGFLPSWAQDRKVQPINMRLDKARGKFWRQAFIRRRAVIPVDWWYEWRRESGGKQPYAIRPAGVEGGFFFAGVWSQPKAMAEIDSAWAGCRTFAIVTTEADDSISAIHSRMPVALTDEGARRWLAESDDPDDLHARLQGGIYPAFEFWPVSRAVNSPANAYPEVAERVEGADLS